MSACAFLNVCRVCEILNDRQIEREMGLSHGGQAGGFSRVLAPQRLSYAQRIVLAELGVVDFFFFFLNERDFFVFFSQFLIFCFRVTSHFIKIFVK